MDESKDLQNTPLTPEKPDPLPDVKIHALRTYKSDINHTVNKDKITTAKILMAEQRAQTKQKTVSSQTSVTKPKNMIALIFGILLIASSVALVGFFGYTKILNKTPIELIVSESHFLFAFDKQSYIDVEEPMLEILESVESTVRQVQSDKNNTYTDVIFFKNNKQTKTGNKISASELFKTYDIKLPSIISRSISKDYTYGLYKTGARVEPFLIIGLVDYENAFDAMFGWESTLALDIREFFPNLKEIFDKTNEQGSDIEESTSDTATTTPASVSEVATTTSSSTSTLQATTTVPNTVINRNVVFTDVVLSNKDTRAVRDENGSPYFYYTFIDRDKIMFAQDPKLITEIVRKIREKQLVR